MNPVSSNRAVGLPDLATAPAAEPVSTQAQRAVETASPTRVRPEGLPPRGMTATRMVFKERFKDRLFEKEDPKLGVGHHSALDRAIYKTVVDDAVFVDTSYAPRLRQRLVSLHRLHQQQQARSLPQFIHSLLVAPQGGAARQAASVEGDPLQAASGRAPLLQAPFVQGPSEQLSPEILPGDALLSLTLGTQHLTGANCTAEDVEAITGVLQVIKQRLDQAGMANIAEVPSAAYFICMIAKTAGPLVSRLFFEAQVIPLDRSPGVHCANTDLLMQLATQHGSIEFIKEFVQSGVTLQVNLDHAIGLLRRVLRAPEAGVDGIKKFVDAGIDLVRLRLDGGATVLHHAAQGSTPAVVEYLLSLRGQRRSRLNVNEKTIGGADALRLAANNAEHGGAIARLLIERDASVEFDPASHTHPAHCMIAADNEAGLQAILDGLSRSQKERLINTRYPGPDVELVIYAALHGTAPMVEMILNAELGARETLELNARYMFEVSVEAATKGEEWNEQVARLIANVPEQLLRELDKKFSFYEQAASLPCAPAVLDCLVARNALAIAAGAEPLFVIPNAYDPRATVLGVTLTQLDRDERLRLIAALSLDAQGATNATAAGGSGSCISEQTIR